MRAIQVTGPGDVRLIDTAALIADDGVRLRVEIVGLCGTDLNIFRGRNAMVSFPRVIGHEVAATLLEPAEIDGVAMPVGTPVTLSPYTACGNCASCRRGRANACQFNQTFGVQRDGALREELSVPAEKLYVGNLSLRELALVEPLSVGCHAAARGRVTAQDTVVVFGCGAVGLGAVAAAAFRGARVIAVDVDDAKLALAARAGAAELLNTRLRDLHTTLQDLTDGAGPDCIIEAIGLPETFRAAVEEVAFTGRVVYIGYAKEQVSYETRLFVQKELDIMGSRNALPDDFHEAIRMLEAGHFPVDDMISAIVPMEEAPEWLRKWAAHPEAITKILVQVNTSGAGVAEGKQCRQGT